MAFYLSDEILDYPLNEVAKSTMEAVCNAQPTSYFHACRPNLWVIDTAYSIGDIVRSGTAGFVYECIIAGTSGSLEPSWGNGQDQEFVEGPNTLRWKTHSNFALSNVALGPSDFSITTVTAPPHNGRMLIIAEKAGVTTHTTGTVLHTAFYNESEKKLYYVAEAETTLIGDNDINSGRTTVFQTVSLISKQPEVG